MYAKLIGGALQVAPRNLTGDGVTVYNPPGEMYLAQGWKPVRLTEAPEAPKGYVAESGWEETADAIVETWTIVEEPDISDAEAYDIIFGGGDA